VTHLDLLADSIQQTSPAAIGEVRVNFPQIGTLTCPVWAYFMGRFGDPDRIDQSAVSTSV
jgi:hypothetical protein